MTTYPSRQNLIPSAPTHSISPSPAAGGKLAPGTKVQIGKYVVRVDKFLSEGGFAHVYVASLISPSSVEGFPSTQKQFVLKRMAVPDKAGLVEVRKEVDVMKQLRPHKHVVYFIEASASSLSGSSGYEIFILMEWCPGGGIIDLLNSRLQNRLTESEILKIFSDTVDAVAHMHSQTPILIHRDLKVENILVAAPNLYKLCDFGSTASPLPHPPRTTAEIQALEADLNKHTTLQYRAPEMVDVWSRKGVTEKADIWALGVFLYKLCYYTTPFEEHGPMAIVNVQYKIPPYPAYSNSIKYLIGTMLQELAQSRPDIWQVHEHTCRLRGLKPYLTRPHANNHSSAQPLKQSSTSSKPSSMNNLTGSGGLNSIFQATVPPPVSTHPIETVVPMRRGRPTGKPKDATWIPNTGGQQPDLLELNSTEAKEIMDQPASSQPPEESDLFAREAAAGFGDAFLSTSPGLASQAPATTTPTWQRDVGSTTATNPQLIGQAPPKPPGLSQTSSRKDPHSAFDDLVPVKKSNPTKTLNEMRGTNPGNMRPTTASSVVQSQGHARPINSNHYGQPRREASLSQKTGPQAFPASREDDSYRKISLTQKTGPALISKTTNHPPLSLSDLLKKDQAQLVSRSTQTSPSLLKSLVNELISNTSLKGLSDQQLAGRPVAARSTSTTDLLTGDDTMLETHLPLLTKQTNTRPKLECIAAGTSSHTSWHSSDQNRSKSGLHPANSISDSSSAVNHKEEPPLSSHASSKISSISSSRPNLVKTNPDEILSSDSDDEPENPESSRRYGGRTRKSPPSSNIPAGLVSKPLGQVPATTLGSSSVADNKEINNESIISSNRQIADSTLTETTGSTFSDEMTEEDEETKARRRAAIAKFAPAPKKEEIVERDPFASRAKSRSPSPEPVKSPLVMDKPSIRKQAAPPPLRAPKPQSLKSAAAITNLVSRYENLSSGDKTPVSAISLKSADTKLDLGKTERQVNNNIGRRQSAYRPTGVTNTMISPQSNGKPYQAHIPRKSLGPGLEIKREEENEENGEEEEEKFDGVNNLKSRWETGAVKRAEQKTRVPRSDYGQS